MARVIDAERGTERDFGKLDRERQVPIKPPERWARKHVQEIFADPHRAKARTQRRERRRERLRALWARYGAHWWPMWVLFVVTVSWTVYELGVRAWGS